MAMASSNTPPAAHQLVTVCLLQQGDGQSKQCIGALMTKQATKYAQCVETRTLQKLEDVNSTTCSTWMVNLKL